jgi:hypothetical protein
MISKTEGLIVMGGAAGVAIPILVREYIDTTTEKAPDASITFDWKRPSALVGLIGGSAALVAGLFGGRYIPGGLAPILGAAGAPMIGMGAYSAMNPVYPTASDVPGPDTPSGGYRAASARARVVRPTTKANGTSVTY